VRFFASIGTSIHGPSTVEELLKTPNFDGDTLVCPVGSQNSEDWQPALAYPPLRAALLAPSSPPPALKPETSPCRKCAHENPRSFRYCNECGAPRAEPAPPTPEPIQVPQAAAPPETFGEVAAEVAPELTSPVDSVLEPEAAPAAPAPRKKFVVPIIVGAAAAGTVLAWRFFHYSPVAKPVQAVSVPAPVAAAPPPVALATAAIVAPPVPAPTVKVVVVESKKVPSPPQPPKPVKKRKARRPLRAAKKWVLDAPPDPPKIEKAPVPPAEVPKPADGAKPAAAEPSLLLPGVPRRVSAHSPVAPAAAAPETKADAGDDGATKQVREQFQFCSSLLAQGAYSDHFETCLCADAKQAAPYRGRAAAYSSALKKATSAHTLAMSVSATAVSIDGATAHVTAQWTPQGASAPRAFTESWQLEDGLWCRSSAAENRP
jgi:hypothetical protein